MPARGVIESLVENILSPYRLSEVVYLDLVICPWVVENIGLAEKVTDQSSRQALPPIPSSMQGIVR